MKFAYLYLVLSLVFTGLVSQARAASLKDEATAAISKIDGDGLAKVRRKTGIESVAGVNQELFAGDRISTDARSVVEIMLSDGTMVRIGLNSEYRLESVEKKNGIFSWVFDLTKGSIRAMVEKNPQKDTVKFRVNTPVGTMGVRGTELVLEHNEKNKITTLGVIEGRVEFGQKGCQLKSKCIELRAGETASLGAGGSEQPVIESTGLASLLLLNDRQDKRDASMDAATDEERLARAALFTDLKRADNLKNSTRGLQPKDVGDVNKILKEASAAMADAQDKLIGRTKADRDALEKAIGDGSYADRLKLAEKFDDLRDDVEDKGNEKGKDRETENLNASAVAKKLKVAEAILKSKKMQTALDKRAAKDIDLIEAKLEAAQANLSAERKKSEIAKLKTATATSTSTATNTGEQLSNNYTTATGGGTTTNSATETETNSAQAQEEARQVREATTLLNRSLADGILQEKHKVLNRAYYAYETKKCFAFICWKENEFRSDPLETENSKIERRAGLCYQTTKNCRREMIPCNLKNGKSCKPKFTEYACKEVKVQVACPSTGNGRRNNNR